jgi:ADP-ribosylglycohydrolase
LRHCEYKQKKQEHFFYKDAMTHIIREGGDTDTNAAIAGGMIGALIGLSQIDEVMRNKVLTFDCT